MHLFKQPPAMPSPETALPGRSQALQIDTEHFVNGHTLVPPFPEFMETALFGLGCFWGAERRFWKITGVYSTAAGYSGGFTPNPTYEEVCTGKTGHNEVVLVVFHPDVVTYPDLLKIFWESHNPTQYMRQGNDSGTQYRSAIYTYNEKQAGLATRSREICSRKLHEAGYPAVVTEIQPAGEFYYAETYHQQYLAKNPAGYCGLGGTGIELDCSGLNC